MNFLVPIVLILTTYLAVFLESSLGRFHELLGTTIKLLPGLMVYTGLSTGPGTIGIVATLAGLWFDSLSSNPLGISVLPLLAIGLVIQQCRELVLREEAYAQFVLGVIANIIFPLFSVCLLFLTGRKPLFGLVSLGPLVFTAVFGGISTMLFFRLFDRIRDAFAYKPLPESSFRPDREIKRGRA